MDNYPSLGMRLIPTVAQTLALRPYLTPRLRRARPAEEERASERTPWRERRRPEAAGAEPGPKDAE